MAHDRPLKTITSIEFVPVEWEPLLGQPSHIRQMRCYANVKNLTEYARLLLAHKLLNGTEKSAVAYLRRWSSSPIFHPELEPGRLYICAMNYHGPDLIEAPPDRLRRLSIDD